MSMTMPAGQYWLGDPCYVMHDAWGELMDQMFPNNQPNAVDGIFTLKDGRQVAIFSTAYGDGVYEDNKYNTYPVDAGCLGCVLVDDVLDAEADLSLGNIITFEKPFEVYESDGDIHFGHICISTGFDDYDEE